jgi:hypothetical protein
MPLQQHLSIVFFVSVQRSFPSFCGTQQHFVSSLPVRVQVSFGGVAEMSVALASMAINANHFVIVFINSPPSTLIDRSLRSYSTFCISLPQQQRGF